MFYLKMIIYDLGDGGEKFTNDFTLEEANEWMNERRMNERMYQRFQFDFQDMVLHCFTYSSPYSVRTSGVAFSNAA